MSAWNVFKMELFKGVNDRVNLIIMFVLMAINMIGGLLAVNNTFNVMVMTLFSVSVMASMLFLFVYPYQMARQDYKNRVMSLLIASGMSRVQYYFVKVGATLIFAFANLVLVVIIPVLVVLASYDISVIADIFNITIAFDDVMVILLIISTFLYIFFMLMTAVIISRGRAYTIFVFLGLLFGMSMITSVFHYSQGVLHATYASLITQFISMILMGAIGIFVLKRQDL